MSSGTGPDAILSAEQIEAYCYGDAAYGENGDIVTALINSHEALRRRLADTEAERDAAYDALDAGGAEEPDAWHVSPKEGERP